MQTKVMNRVKLVRQSRDLSQDEVGAKIGKARGQISRIESGKVALTEHWLNLLSKALDCSPAELIADIDPPRQVPIVGEVPGGDLMEAIQREPEGFVLFNSRRRNLKAFRVRGNSMSRIAPDGMYVVADFDDNDPATLNNQPVLFCIDHDGTHECSFKLYKRNPDRFVPHSIDVGYDDIFPGEKPWKIYARVIGALGFLGDNTEFVRIPTYN